MMVKAHTKLKLDEIDPRIGLPNDQRDLQLVMRNDLLCGCVSTCILRGRSRPWWGKVRWRNQKRTRWWIREDWLMAASRDFLEPLRRRAQAYRKRLPKRPKRWPCRIRKRKEESGVRHDPPETWSPMWPLVERFRRWWLKDSCRCCCLLCRRWRRWSRWRSWYRRTAAKTWDPSTARAASARNLSKVLSFGFCCFLRLISWTMSSDARTRWWCPCGCHKNKSNESSY